MKLPIVIITTIDHAVTVQGELEVPIIAASGILVKETKQGYFLSPMLFNYNPNDEDNVTLFIAKGFHTKKKTVGYYYNGNRRTRS